MKKYIFSLAICFFFLGDAISQQGSAFGIKLGPTVGFQKWSSARDSEVLFRYHALAYIETYRKGAEYALFAQTGYHVRGGALRIRGGSFQTFNNNIVDIPTRSYPYEFKNLSLSLGAKQRFIGVSSTLYWMLGVRGEYTIGTNLDMYHEEDDPFEQFNIIHPFPGSNVRKINYGVIVGGGVEFMFSELVGGMAELSISPDLSQQYFSPQFSYNRLINGVQTPTTIQERKINNISIELSIGIRLLRIVEYVDNVF